MNPRETCAPNGFRDRRIRPLCPPLRGGPSVAASRPLEAARCSREAVAAARVRIADVERDRSNRQGLESQDRRRVERPRSTSAIRTRAAATASRLHRAASKGREAATLGPPRRGGQSGRMRRSRKPFGAQVSRGFKSLPLRLCLPQKPVSRTGVAGLPAWLFETRSTFPLETAPDTAQRGRRCPSFGASLPTGRRNASSVR